MSKVNGQSVAARGKCLWAGPTLFIFLFHVKHAPATCGLWPRLADYGACLWAGPTLIFYFCLRAGGILPALCPCSGFFDFTLSQQHRIAAATHVRLSPNFVVVAILLTAQGRNYFAFPALSLDREPVMGSSRGLSLSS